jgi:hypothetical protein
MVLGICYDWAVDLGLGLEPFAGMNAYKRKRARAERHQTIIRRTISYLLFLFLLTLGLLISSSSLYLSLYPVPLQSLLRPPSP